MGLKTRRWLSWTEAAEVLGFDSLGLQQEFQHRATQDDADLWLPVFVNSTSEMLFFGAFGFDGYDRIEVQHAWPLSMANSFDPVADNKIDPPRMVS